MYFGLLLWPECLIEPARAEGFTLSCHKMETRHRVTKSSRKEPNSVSEKVDCTQPDGSRANASTLEPLTWTPATFTAFKVLLSARLCAAVWSNIQDCDETYNYWEPTHYLMYGRGMQTWEYSPLYAIRSYAYLWLYALPGFAYSSLLQDQRTLVFYFMRCVIGAVEAICEAYFYKAIRHKFGKHIAKIYFLMTIFATGMFISSAAFLPSSFGMKLLMLSYGAWWNDNCFFALFSAVLSALVGWPFTGILVVPIFIDALLKGRKYVINFIQYGLLSSAVIMPIVITVDSIYFGKLVFAAKNIVLYNVFSPHGPNLYGVEPFDFYIRNGIINFNYAFLMALAAIPLLAITKYFRIPTERLEYTSLLGMYIWFIIFFSQPHKEERFLYPVYPLVLLNASVCSDLLQRWLHHLFYQRTCRHHLDLNDAWWLLPVMFSCFLGMSRCILLYKAYSAPMTVSMELARIANRDGLSDRPLPSHPVYLCVGKEWHRFPASYFLPDRWELQFIKSEFRGQLPKPFSLGVNATRTIPTEMNDANREEPSRYLSLSKCHYLMDTDRPKVTSREPNFTKHSDFELVYSTEFMDTENTPLIARLVYIPFVWETRTTFVKYNLLRNKKNHISYEKSPVTGGYRPKRTSSSSSPRADNSRERA